jgi:hypothetical protein
MTTLRRRGLQIDDPLGPGRPIPLPASADSASEREGNDGARGDAPAVATPAGSARKPRRIAREPATSRGARPSRRNQPGRQEQPAPSGEGVWREWSGLTGVGSFRLPHGLLAELGDTARELGLPIGMIVAAAIAQLLDQPPEEIAMFVDRADDARI